MAESPSPAEVDHLDLCGNTVRSLEDVLASGAHLLNPRQCRDLSCKLSKATGNVRELVLYCETSMITPFRPGLESLHRCLEKAEALVRSCAEEDWCRAAVLQIDKESAFWNILEDVGSCYKAIYEVAKSAVQDWNGGPEDLQQSSVFESARDSDVHEDQVELEKRLNDSAQVELLNVCRKIVLSVRNVVKNDKVLLNRRQCVDLSSKLCTTALNVLQLVSCGGASVVQFHLALKSLYQVLERAKAVVSSCADDDWLAAAVFQADNENAFRMILLDVSMCYNALYEIAKSTSKLWNNPPEDLRHPSVLVFMPAQSSDVDEDKRDLQKMLDDLANGYTKFKVMDYLVPGRISRTQSLAKYLLVKMCSTPSDPQAAHLDIYSTLLWRKVSEPMRTWGSVRFLGSGSGASGVVSTTWLGIPCAKKEFHTQDHEGFFLKEAGILAHLKHPCVVNFVCCGNGLAKGDRFIAMELMEKSLADLIDEQRKVHFPLHVVVDMMVQIARGVCYLHGRGVAHRDVKPQNVVVSRLKSVHGESHYCLKLVDFGMSKTKVEASKVNTMSAFGIGTTRYRAPELGRQAHPHGCGRVAWFKADAYSFAMTCAHLLTLKTPFQEVKALQELDLELMNGVRPSLPSDCPKEIVSLLEDCWNTRPELRPTFGEVCTRLEKFKYALLRGSVGGNESTGSNVVEYDFIKRKVEEQSSHQAMLVQPGVGSTLVSGAGQPQSNPLGVIAGATAGVNAGVNTGVDTIPPASGLPQPVQAGSSASTITPPTTPPPPPGALKYTKLWEGILAGQRQQKPVPICKLEGYRQTSASEKLAADWPTTMRIVLLIAQDYMNSKEYQGKAEFLVFRPLSQHGFLGQLAEKKLCAVIQLPSQTLLLASTGKPGRMIGMLYPGDMVMSKLNQPTGTQQPTGAVAPMAGTGPAMGQALGQSNFSQGQLQGQLQDQMNPQQLNPQQMAAQQMNPQQMGGQQLNPQQMNVQQLNPQQMSVQHKYSQQMYPEQTHPIMPVQDSFKRKRPALQGNVYSLP